MALIGLGCRGDDGLGESLVLLHAVGQFHTTEFTATVLVLAPGRTCQDGTDNHLHTETLALQTDGHHRVGSSQLPVRTDIRRGIEELSSDLVEHLTFKWNTLRQYHVES